MSDLLAVASFGPRLSFRPRARNLSGREIMANVAARHDLTVEDLTGRSNWRRVAWPRQEAMWEMRQLTKLSTTQIGALLGGRDHTTVLHGVRKHSERMSLPQDDELSVE